MATIVLAEDDEAVRPFVKRALETQGHLVHAFENGEEALDFLCMTEEKIDLLLSDIKMPIMDGIELAGSVARILPELPILLMTGYADQREGAKALQALIIDVIAKPFSLATIRERVSEALKTSHKTI